MNTVVGKYYERKHTREIMSSSGRGYRSDIRVFIWGKPGSSSHVELLHINRYQDPKYLATVDAFHGTVIAVGASLILETMDAAK